MACSGHGARPHRLVVGLGNPGPRYAATRHNLGFTVLGLLAERWAAGPWEACCASLVAPATVGGVCVWLACPQTFMNRSGVAVALLREHSGLEMAQLVVVHDDLDLPLGNLRIRSRGGHGGHNGIRSVMESLGAGDFVRLKLGIGRPAEGVNVVDHVLSPFLPPEQAVLSGLLERAVDTLESIVVEGPTRARDLLSSSTSEKGGTHGKPS